MSEPEGFLSRWARRKRESGEETHADRAPDRASAPSSAPSSARSSLGDEQPVSATRSVEESRAAPEVCVDLSALPPIESITATTDIRPFLAPGVPSELTRAALRRAWLADPQIRDFVGIAENQWDFSDPSAIPGFGALGPLDARRLLMAALGTSEEAAASPLAAGADEKPGLKASPAASGASAGDMSALEAPAPGTPPAPETTRRGSEASTAAPHQDDPGAPAAPLRRGHGSALPR